ncbi:NAD-dependent epimerase/dehydratase family protein [Candidatus Venteria ishoeyi]|uniref:NAD-dependent epimerase/dehydratase family protein n=1 Tax=Candidatus Venteria ishoeyi TaxID=1899563 RepID=UPI0025A68B59|nr:NAD-dependent epimerase/dehydratase family protein [Candidatus Venteria ishoeyi]MDM8546312.1 NAD-dependent epimerase/dehydratase family protein [Candidatus Venteria ishoeyi]
MKILIIGGNGFIGSHLVDSLLSHGYQVRVFDRSPEKFRAPLPNVEYRLYDFNDFSALTEALEGIDIVFHLLSTTAPSTSNINPASDIEDNLVGTIKLLQIMVQKKITRMIYISSGGTVYGVPQIVPIPESHPLNPICSYGVVKVAIEKYLFMYQQLYGIRSVILRPSNPYGERQGHGGVQGVIGTFLDKLIKNEQIEIWGDGSVVRDFIHVTDLAKLCRIAAEKDVCGVYNTGTGIGYSILDILDVIRNVSGKNCVPTFSLGRKYDVPRSILDISKAKYELKWYPHIDLKQGVARTYDWLVNNS